jgi:hypothetical protein
MNFLYELHNKAGKCIVTQSVTGRIAPILKHISEVVNTHGKDATVHIIKARINEDVKSGLKKSSTNVLVDPQRMESLSALVTLAVEHYNSKTGDLVVENAYSKSLDETLTEVLTDPKKAKKLMEAAEQYQISAAARKHGYVRSRKSNSKTTIYAQPTTGHVLTYWNGHNKWEHYNPDLSVSKSGEGHKELDSHLAGIHDEKLAEAAEKLSESIKCNVCHKNRKLKDGVCSNCRGVAQDKHDEEMRRKSNAMKDLAHSLQKENVQGDVRKHKEAHPEKYCKNPKCLWRVSSGPCPKHGIKEAEDTLKLPDLNVGDILRVGKFKNRRAEIKGFDKDENNQPVALTDKNDQKIFKPRIEKLMVSK